MSQSSQVVGLQSRKQGRESLREKGLESMETKPKGVQPLHLGTAKGLRPRRTRGIHEGDTPCLNDRPRLLLLFSPAVAPAARHTPEASLRGLSRRLCSRLTR